MYAACIQILEPVIQETTRLLQDFGRREAVVYWAGLELAGRWLITTAVCPRQENTRGSFICTAGDNARVVQEISSHRLAILGQVHTHPGQMVGHSEGDDEWATFAFPGFLSVVVPVFGQRGMLPLSICGIHRHEDEFRRLSPGEISRVFSIVPVSMDQREHRFLFRC